MSNVSHTLVDGTITFSWDNPVGAVAVLAEVVNQFSRFSAVLQKSVTDLEAPFSESVSYTPTDAGNYTVYITVSSDGVCSGFYQHKATVSVAEHDLKCPDGQHRHDTQACGADHTCPDGRQPVDHDTCRPPVPTGVKAACSNGVANVTWNTAGTGSAKATSYKPRIFIGGSATPDARWTTGTAGHATTSAAIPASGEPDLPETGVFQVKVKASNAAGDSAWSAAVDVTCGPAEQVSGLSCAAAGDDGFTLEWDVAAGADRYEARYRNRSLLPPRWSSWVRISESRAGTDRVAYALGGLGASGLATYYDLQVRAANEVGNGDASASVSCRTVDEDWLDVDCSANGVLRAEWSDPSGNLPEPSGYRVIIYNDDPERGRVAVHTYSGTGTVMAKPLAFGEEYEVSLVSLNGNGGPVYSQAETETCPVHTDNWNSPNFYDPDEDCNNDTPLVGWVANALCRVGESQIQIAESYQELFGLKPALIDVDPVLLSRTCDTTVPNRRTCRETWSENLILLKNPGIDWKAIRIDDWSGPSDVILNLGTIVSFAALVVSAPTLSWVYFLTVSGAGVSTAGQVYGYLENAEGKEFLRLYPVKAAAVSDAAGASLNVEGITNFQGCLSEYDLSPQTDTITVINTYGSFTDERISTYHYCKPE